MLLCLYSFQLVSVSTETATKHSTTTLSSKVPSPSTPTVDLLTDQPLIDTPKESSSDAPLIGGLQSSPLPRRAMKDSIMSLYNVQPGYSAHGHTVGKWYGWIINEWMYG